MSKRDKSASNAEMKKFTDQFKPLFEKWKSEEEGRSQTVFADILFHDILGRDDVKDGQSYVSRWCLGKGSKPKGKVLDGICQILKVDKEIFDLHDFMDSFHYSTETQDKILEAYNINAGSDNYEPGFYWFLSFLKRIPGFDDFFPLYTPLEFDPNEFDANDKYGRSIKDENIAYRYKRAPYSLLSNAAESDSYNYLQVKKEGHYKNLSEIDKVFLYMLEGKVIDLIKEACKLREDDLRFKIPLKVNRLMSSFGYDVNDKGAVFQKQLPNHIKRELYDHIQNVVVTNEDDAAGFVYNVTGDDKQKEKWKRIYTHMSYIYPHRPHPWPIWSDIPKADIVVNEDKKAGRTANKRKEDNNGDD